MVVTRLGKTDLQRVVKIAVKYMKAVYYNDIDIGATEWLKKLINQKLIPDGDVDTRSITEVKPEELRGYTQCHFFAGIGGWPLALSESGWDVDRPVWTGSCPCQSFSTAGKQRGFDDERHLWPYFYRLIRECRPSTVFGEQVASKIALSWIDDVQSDLENENYTVASFDLCASGFGAPHVRQRLYWVANSETRRWRKKQQDTAGVLERVDSTQHEAGRLSTSRPTNGWWGNAEWIRCQDNKYRAIEPRVSPLVNGVPNRLVKLSGYGNAIVIPVAKEFIEAYMSAYSESY